MDSPTEDSRRGKETVRTSQPAGPRFAPRLPLGALLAGALLAPAGVGGVQLAGRAGIASVDEAGAIEPSDDVTYELALERVQAERVHEALALAEAGQLGEAQLGNLYRQIAYAARNMRRCDLEVLAYRRLAELDGPWYPPHGLADAYARWGMADEVCAAWAELPQKPGSRPAFESLRCRLDAGVAVEELLAELVAVLDGNYQPAPEPMADVYWRMGYPELAIERLEQALADEMMSKSDCGMAVPFRLTWVEERVRLQLATCYEGADAVNKAIPLYLENVGSGGQSHAVAESAFALARLLSDDDVARAFDEFARGMAVLTDAVELIADARASELGKSDAVERVWAVVTDRRRAGYGRELAFRLLIRTRVPGQHLDVTDENDAWLAFAAECVARPGAGLAAVDERIARKVQAGAVDELSLSLLPALGTSDAYASLYRWCDAPVTSEFASHVLRNARPASPHRLKQFLRRL